jgi:membrane-bound serine protease (ClpP class)
VVGAGGLVAFLLGSLFMFDAESGLTLPRSLIFGVGGTFAAIVLVVGTLVFRSQRTRPAGGAEGMVGAIGVARGRLSPAGTVLVRGEYWNAESEEAVDDGGRVEVTGVTGLRLRVRPVRSGSR